VRGLRKSTQSFLNNELKIEQSEKRGRWFFSLRGKQNGEKEAQKARQQYNVYP
jgi:hypothetical protein